MTNNYNMGIINSTDEDIKSITHGAVSDLKVFLKIPKDTPIYVNNDIDELAESAFGESKPSVQPSVRKINVSVEENNDDFEDNSLTFGYDEFIPVFLDNESNVKISPVFKTFKYNLNIEISLKSKAIANTILHRIRQRDSLIRKDFRHADIAASCFLDNRVLYLLDKINDKRKKVYPDDTLATYIKKYKDDNTLKIVNSGGDANKNILAIQYSYSNMYGHLVTEANGLKAERNKENEDWLITLDYEIRFDRILEINVQYPSMIFNSIIQRDLIQNIDPYKHYVNDPYYQNEFDQLTRINRAIYTDSSNLYVTIPSWDSKTLQPNGNDFKIIFTILLSVEEDYDEKIPICNLRELGKKIKIRDDILDFLKKEYPYILAYYKSIFILNLYENDMLIHNDHLQLDEDLNVYIVRRHLDIKKIYRLSFSICVNPNVIAREAYDRLVANELIVERVNNIIVINDIYNYDLYKAGTGNFYTKTRDVPVLMKTVQTISIQAAGLLEYIGKD